MKVDETTWEFQPRAGWDVFQAARTRVGDVMWADSQLHNIARDAHGGQRATAEATAACQLRDATD